MDNAFEVLTSILVNSWYFIFILFILIIIIVFISNIKNKKSNKNIILKKEKNFELGTILQHNKSIIESKKNMANTETYFTYLQNKENEYKHKNLNIRNYENKYDLEKDKLKNRSLKLKAKELIFMKKVYAHYIKRGYSVKLNDFSKNIVNNSIDLICLKKNKILLIKCKYWIRNSQDKIKDSDIALFHDSAMKYVDDNRLKIKDLKLKYIISTKKVIFKNSIDTFEIEYNQYKYKVI